METSVTVTNTAPYPKRCGNQTLPPGVPVIVPISFLTEYGYDREIVVDYSEISDTLRSRTEDGRPYFDFHCPLSVVDGYGRHALDIWRGLKMIGVETTLRNPGYFVDRQFLPDAIRNEVITSARKPPSLVGVAMTVPYDPGLHQHESLKKIAITQFETDHFPEYHVTQVNKCDHLIVTSHFQPPMMRTSGVTIPINVLTPGIDTEYFAYRKRKRDGLFKVLMLGALTPRKNPWGGLQMFEDASMNDGTWRLTFKSRPAAGFDEVAQYARRDKRVNIIIGDSSPDEIRDLYYSHDCLIWPSKGEGCGLPPLEAMSTGMEVVLSNNSGMMDYVGTWCFPIKMRGMESAAGPNLFDEKYIRAYGDVGNWWLPDEKDAIKQLRRCFEEWEKGNGRGKDASMYVAANHTLEKQAKSVLAIVERYL